MKPTLRELKDPIAIVEWCVEHLPKHANDISGAVRLRNDRERLQFVLNCEAAVLDHIAEALSKVAEAMKAGKTQIEPY